MAKQKIGIIQAQQPRFVDLNPDDYDIKLTSDFFNRAPEPLAPEPEQERSWTQGIGDTLIGATRSTLIVPKTLGVGYGLATGNMDNYLLENADRADEILRDSYSDPLKKKIAARDKKIKEADGFVDKTTTAFGETVGDAALALDTVASNIGSLVTMGGVGAAAKLAVAGRGLRGMGPLAPAVADKAAKVGTRTALGAGSALQGADVAGNVYKSAMAKPDEAWAQNEKFMDAVAKTDGSDEAIKNLKHEFALKAARVAFPAAATVSLAASKLVPGGSAIEGALVNGLGKSVGKGGFWTGVGAAAKTLAGETFSEGLEEGGGAIAGNVIKQQFVDPNQDYFEDAAENTGMGAAGGFLMGGVPAAMQGYSVGKGDEQNQLPVIGGQVPPGNTPNNPGNTPNTPPTTPLNPASPLNAVQQAAQQPGSVLSRAAVAGNAATPPNTAAVASNIAAAPSNIAAAPSNIAAAPSNVSAAPSNVAAISNEQIQFADLLDTDEVYGKWSNVRDGSDREEMRNEMNYISGQYLNAIKNQGIAPDVVKADLKNQFKWFRSATPEQQDQAVSALYAQVGSPITPADEFTQAWNEDEAVKRQDEREAAEKAAYEAGEWIDETYAEDQDTAYSYKLAARNDAENEYQIIPAGDGGFMLQKRKVQTEAAQTQKSGSKDSFGYVHYPVNAPIANGKATITEVIDQEKAYNIGLRFTDSKGNTDRQLTIGFLPDGTPYWFMGDTPQSTIQEAIGDQLFNTINGVKVTNTNEYAELLAKVRTAVGELEKKANKDVDTSTQAAAPVAETNNTQPVTQGESNGIEAPQTFQTETKRQETSSTEPVEQDDAPLTPEQVAQNEAIDAALDEIMPETKQEDAAAEPVNEQFWSEAKALSGWLPDSVGKPGKTGVLRGKVRDLAKKVPDGSETAKALKQLGDSLGMGQGDVPPIKFAAAENGTSPVSKATQDSNAPNHVWAEKETGYAPLRPKDKPYKLVSSNETYGVATPYGAKPKLHDTVQYFASIDEANSWATKNGYSFGESPYTSDKNGTSPISATEETKAPESQLVQDFIDGKTDTPPSVDEVKAELDVNANANVTDANLAPGTRINGQREKDAANRLEKLYEQMGNITKRDTPEGAAKGQVRSLIEELRKERTAVSVVPILGVASQRLARNYGAFSRVLDEVAESLSDTAQPNSADTEDSKDRLNNKVAPVSSIFTGKPDPKNSAPVIELDGFKVGDEVSIPNRTFGRGKVESLFTRAMAGMEPATMARVVHDDGKTLDVLTSELKHETKPDTAQPNDIPSDRGMTLLEARNALIEVNTRIANQGRVSDDRLLEKKRQIEKLITQLETEKQATDKPQNTAPNILDVGIASGRVKVVNVGDKPVKQEAKAEPKADPLDAQAKAAKAKMFNALSKLANMAGKNTRMNWTPEEEQQLLPVVIELFDGAMELGQVTFKKAVRYVREFIASGIDQETADSIPYETLQGAYIAATGRHKDKPVTPLMEVAKFASLEDVYKDDESTAATDETPVTPAAKTPISTTAENNDLPEGWTEATAGGLATNQDPVTGGIVDRELINTPNGITEGKWFAISNANGKLDGEFESRADAIAAITNAPSKPAKADATPLVTHITAKGKEIKGVVRTDLTLDQAKSIDPYTFKKDGGFFIREKHLDELNAAFPLSKATTASNEVKPSLGDVAGRLMVSKAVADHLITDRFATIVQARQFITNLTGETIEPGTPLAKRADEAIELGVVIASRDIVNGARKQGRSDDVIFDRLLQIYENQPGLNVKDSTSLNNQAYSTPVPLAFVASRLAQVSKDKMVGEPTAGNGALMMEANPATAMVNEFEPNRIEALRSTGFNPTINDAAAMEFPAKTLDSMVMNPPFGSLVDGTEWTFGEFTTNQIDHAIVLNSLEALKDDGNAVLIIGGTLARDSAEEAHKQAYRGSAKRSFFANLYSQYNVVDHFSVSGDLYRKQGAGFPVDVLVIRGRGKSNRPLPQVELPQKVDTWAQLKEKLNEQSSVGTQQQPNIGGNNGERGASPQPGPVSVDTNGASGSSSQGGAGGRKSGVNDADGSGSTGSGTGPNGVSGQTNSPEQRGNDNAPEPQGDTGADAKQGDGKQSGSNGSVQRSNPAGLGNGSGSGARTGLRLGGVLNVKGSNAAPVAPKVALSNQGDGNGLQVPYDNFSENKSVNTLVATNHLGAIKEAFGRLMRRLGISSIDDYVRDELQYDPELFKASFSAEQVEALALAIDNIKRGKGFIIGDQTGIGKGRVVAAMIRYAKINGKTPVFVTQMPDLYGDMMRDLSDIGMGSTKPLMTNNNASVPLDAEALDWFSEKQAIQSHMAELQEEIDNLAKEELGGKLKGLTSEQVEKEVKKYLKTAKNPEILSLKEEVAELKESIPARRGKFLETPNIEQHEDNLRGMVNGNSIGDYDVIFTTYNQLAALDSGLPKKDKETGQKTARKDPVFGYRNKFLEHFVNKNAMLILDESHNAGAADSRNPSKLGNVVRKFIERSGSVFYSSATFAKNTDMMDAYNKTDLGLSFPNADAITQTLSSLPMQQVASRLLVEAGQYLRRERSFAGIDYETNEVVVSKQDTEDLGKAMSLMVAFDDAKKDAIKNIQRELDREGSVIKAVDGGGSQASVDSLNFTSVMHNVVNTFLLALKADATAQAAIDAIAKGEKPVITVANTMEMFINEFAADRGLGMGDKFNATYADVLRKYLENTRKAKTTDANGNSEVHYLTDEELGSDGVDAYNDALDFIDSLELDVPISPIDHIKQRIEEAGYSIGEITGRQTVVVNGVLRPRNKAEQKTAGKKNTIAKFNNGGLDALIINRSGSTGLSMHASEKFGDQRRRVMIIGQAELDINNHMQMLGRINRTGQVTQGPFDDDTGARRVSFASRARMAMQKAARIGALREAANNKVFGGKTLQRASFDSKRIDRDLALAELPKVQEEDTGRQRYYQGKPASYGLPHYYQMTADVPIELRPAAVLAKKMAALNANTTAEKKSAVEAGSLDFMNKYGDLVAVDVLMADPGLNAKLGFPVRVDANGDIDPKGVIAKVTGRVGLLPLKDQSDLYQKLATEYKLLIEQLDAMGMNDLEAKTYPLDAKLIKTEELLTGDDESPFTSAVTAESVNVRKLGKPYSSEKVKELIEKTLGGPISRSLSNEHYQSNLDKYNKRIQSEIAAFEQVVADNASAAAVANAKTRIEKLKTNQTRFREVLQSVGLTKVLKTDSGNFYGVVTDVFHSGDDVPTTLSAWKVRFAVVDGAKSITLPFTKIYTPNDSKVPEGGTLVDKATEMMLPTADRMSFEAVSIFDAFDRGQTDSRENRVIVTGNLLRAAANGVKGRIMNYTDENGVVKQGILLPPTDTVQAIAGKFTPSINTYEQLEKVIANDGMAIDKKENGDVVKIVKSWGNSVKIFLGKALGKRIVKRYQDINFTSAGGRFSAQAERGEELKNFFDFLSDQDNGLNQRIELVPDKETSKKVKSGEIRFSRKAGQSDIRMSRGNFYHSALTKGVQGLQTKQTMAGAWNMQIQALVNKGLATQADIDQSGIKDWLKLQEGKITKEQIIEHLNGAGGMPLVKVREIVDVIRSTWKNSPDVVVASNMNDPIIPQAVRDADRLQKSQGAVGDAEGFVYGGKVYVVASEMNAPQDVVRVLFHEALGHMGLRGVYGKSLEQVLNQVILGRRKEVIAKAKSYGLDPSNNDDLLQAAEEVLAEMAQTRPELGFVQRAIAAIRNFLRTHVPKFNDMKFTDADIIQAFILPARRFVENGGGGGGGGGLRYLRAFHGTPHIGIEKFSTDKIGTGEGAQAFGWGLYFASKREIAEHYRIKLSDTRHKTRDGARLFDKKSHGGFASLIDEMRRNGQSQEDVVAYLRRQKSSGHPQWKAAERLAERIEKGTVQFKGGQLYEVEIPEESEMLDWHKPLSEQDEISDAWGRSKWRDIADGENLPYQYTKAKNFAGRTGEDLYKALSSKMGGDKAASKVLNSYGIKGIKYLDDQSRDNGEGSHNYVIFDGADVAIEKTHFSRNGQLLAPNGKPSKLTEGQWHQVRTPQFKAWFGDWESAAILNGEVIATLKTSDAPTGGFKDVEDWAASVFAKQGGKAFRAGIGEILLDHRAAQTSMAHGGATKYKKVAFAAVKDVIERGALVHQSSTPEEDSFYFSAPVDIDGVTNIETVLVHRDVNTKRMYLHSVTTKENLLNQRVSSADAEAPKRSGSTNSEGIAILLQNIINRKGISKAVDPETGEPLASALNDMPSETRFSRTPLANANFSVGAQRNLQNSIVNRLNDLWRSSAKVSWWDKSVGTQYHLSERNSEYKRTFDAVQRFISDTSIFANKAADLAPTMLPKLDKLKDLVKKALPASDVKAVSNAVFGGTLHWSRDAAGNLVEQSAVLEAAAQMSVHDKADALMRAGKISPNVLRMWQGMQIDQYESLINSKYENDVLRPGVVFTPAELRDKFGMTDAQIGLYQEFRKATNESLTDLALSEMVRMGSADLYPISDMIMEHGDVKKAADDIAQYLESMKQANPDREAALSDTIEKVQALADRALDLMNRGYAPLMRFGKYAVYAKGANDEQLFFGMYESQREANWAETALRQHYPQATISSGIMSQEQHKLFQGVSPETLALFGDAMGLDTDSEKAAIYQEFVKLVADSKSTLRRMLNRKGVPGYSEDATRVLAGFITSNSRKVAANLNNYEISKSVEEIKAGDVKDAAIKLKNYVQNPEEEAQWIRGMLFTQYIGGSTASAIVNLTQSLTMTFPYLSQFTSVADAGARMAKAAKMAGSGKGLDADLQQALKRAEDDGVVAPQEIHQLMAHAQGKGGLKSGDGTTTGDALAMGSNALSKAALVWGSLFSAAEVFNRTAAFIAAYQLAKDKNLGDPFAFAEKTVKETQGIYNKGNKSAWARGWVGSILFTFKQFSISYVEFLQRMYANDGRNGQEGKKAMALALFMLWLTAGISGLPGGDDLDDVIDAAAQAMGFNFSFDQAKEDAFESVLGEAGAKFVMHGLTGIPGSPIDISGRMGLGNLIPGTGLLLRKDDHTKDVQELFGPISDLLSRTFNAGGEFFRGNVLDAAKEISPVAARNVLQGADMWKTGMYRDAKDRNVVAADKIDAFNKAIGFQPHQVAQVQKATFTTQRMVANARMVESEIVHEFAVGRFERDQSKIDAARKRLQRWNEKNPSTPIRITAQQVNKKVQNMNKTKAQRMSAAAPKEVRAMVKRELEGY